MSDNKYKILWIDDDEDQLNMYELAFSNRGYEVITNQQGRRTVDLAQKHKPDIIMLDLLLGNVNGLDILEKLKKNPKTKDIKVVITTNLSQKESMERAKKLGASGFLVKSKYVPNQIIKEVSSYLE